MYIDIHVYYNYVICVMHAHRRTGNEIAGKFRTLPQVPVFPCRRQVYMLPTELLLRNE